MRDGLKFLGLGAVVIGVGVGLWKLAKEAVRADAILRNRWTTIKSGFFDCVKYDVRHVEKREDEYGIGRGQSLRWRYRTAKEDITLVVFEDGTSIILNGKMEIPYAKGTQISIRENGLCERQVVPA